MKIAMSSFSGMGAWWVLRLLAEGHDVDYYLSKPDYEDVLGGLIPSPKKLSLDHRRKVQGFGYPSYKGYDLSLFDLTGVAKQADASAMDAPTLGDGSINHMLEDDREAGIQAMEESGIEVPPWKKFTSASEAKAFIKKNDKRYVYKPFEGYGVDDKSLTYVAKSAEDLLKCIDKLFSMSRQAPFLLQEFIKGTEASCMGYFNGEDFYLLTSTLEDKKFMDGDKGPNTGAAGNLVFALKETSRLYTQGLKKAAPFLKNIGYRGMIDLNAIVTQDKLYGLEWTPRFGYIADSCIAMMYGTGFGEMLQRIATGKAPVIKWEAPFSVGITISIPPYPTEIRIPKAKDIPIEGIDPEDIEQLCSMYLYDVKLSKDKKSLITSGNYGYIGAPMGIGESIGEASAACIKLLEKIQVPNMQHRTDTEKSVSKRYNFLMDNSWL